MSFSTNGRFVIAGGHGGSVCIWDRESGKLVEKVIDGIDGIDAYLGYVMSAMSDENNEIILVGAMHGAFVFRLLVRSVEVETRSRYASNRQATRTAWGAEVAFARENKGNGHCGPIHVREVVARDLGRKTLPVGWKANYLPLIRQPMASAGRFSCDASTSCPPLGESTAESFDECNLKHGYRLKKSPYILSMSFPYLYWTRTSRARFNDILGRPGEGPRGGSRPTSQTRVHSNRDLSGQAFKRGSHQDAHDIALSADIPRF